MTSASSMSIDVEAQAAGIASSTDGPSLMRFGELDSLVLAYATTDPQGPGLRISGGGHPGDDAALPDAAAEPALYRHHAGQAAGRAGRTAKGDRHRRPERRGAAALVEARGMAGGRGSREPLRGTQITEAAEAEGAEGTDSQEKRSNGERTEVLGEVVSAHEPGRRRPRSGRPKKARGRRTQDRERMPGGLAFIGFASSRGCAAPAGRAFARSVRLRCSVSPVKAFLRFLRALRLRSLHPVAVSSTPTGAPALRR